MKDHYVLRGHEVVPGASLREWGAMFEDSEKRRVAEDEIGGVKVSTVFIGIDHNWRPGGPPHIFETMIFGGEHDQATWRYSTWDEAAAGHASIVAALERGEEPPE